MSNKPVLLPVQSRSVLPGKNSSRRTTGVPVLGGPTRAEAAVHDLRRAVRDGELLPNQAVSLRSLADERGVRLPALTMMAESLQHERLLEIRGDVAIVAPLDADALASAFRLGDLVAPAVVSRASEAITEQHLREFESRYPPSGVSLSEFFSEDEFHALARVPMELMTTGATPSERYVFSSIHDFNWRNVMLSQRSLSDPARSPWFTFLASWREAIDLIRHGELAAGVDFIHKMNQENQDFVRLSLDLYRGTDDDYPVAEVIPIRRLRAGCA